MVFGEHRRGYLVALRAGQITNLCKFIATYATLLNLLRPACRACKLPDSLYAYLHSHRAEAGPFMKIFRESRTAICKYHWTVVSSGATCNIIFQANHSRRPVYLARARVDARLSLRGLSSCTRARRSGASRMRGTPTTTTTIRTRPSYSRYSSRNFMRDETAVVSPSRSIDSR